MTALGHLFFGHPFVCSVLAPNEKFTESFVKNFTIRASCILFLKMMIAFFVITPLQDHNISMKFYVKSLHTGFLLQYLLIWLVYTVALLMSAIEFSCPELLELPGFILLLTRGSPSPPGCFSNSLRSCFRIITSLRQTRFL